jgi:hypothetical protein
VLSLDQLMICVLTVLASQALSYLQSQLNFGMTFKFDLLLVNLTEFSSTSGHCGSADSSSFLPSKFCRG